MGHRIAPGGLLCAALLAGLSPPAAATPSYSCDWQDLELQWPVHLAGHPYLFPARYVAIDPTGATLVDYQGELDGHNGIDISTASFGPTNNGTATVHAAATGRLVGVRDGLSDRVNAFADWYNQFTLVGKETVTELAPGLPMVGIESTIDGSGNVVYLQHANGFVTQYAHLAYGLAVTETYELGDEVPAGTLLGTLASSGASGGPHLHFGVHTGPECAAFFASNPIPPRIGFAWSPWGRVVSPFYEEAGTGETMWIGPTPTAYKPWRFTSGADRDVVELDVRDGSIPQDTDNPPRSLAEIPQVAFPAFGFKALGALGAVGIEVERVADGAMVVPLAPDRLHQGHFLPRGQMLRSILGRYVAALLADGRLCVFNFHVTEDAGTARWCSPAAPAPADSFYAQQTDDNLCVFAGTGPDDNQGQVWCALDTPSSASKYTVMQDDANLCLYDDSTGAYEWCSFSQNPTPSDQPRVYSNLLGPGGYVVRARRLLKGETEWETRLEQPFEVLGGLTEQTLPLTAIGSIYGLAAGDYFDHPVGLEPVEGSLSFKVVVPAFETASTLRAARLSLALDDVATFQGTNPFDHHWGATPRLGIYRVDMSVQAGGAGGPLFDTRVGELSPAWQTGQSSSGYLFDLTGLGGATPTELWVSFDVPHNGNGASDHIVFDDEQVTLQLFWQLELAPQLDIDGDGSIGPLTDAVLVLRYLFGFRGGALIAGAVSPSCVRCSSGAIESHIASMLARLDLDGDGLAEPLTDGVLFLRYAFGFRGATWTAGVVDLLDCTRCDGGSIEAFLGGIDPLSP